METRNTICYAQNGEFIYCIDNFKGILYTKELSNDYLSLEVIKSVTSSKEDYYRISLGKILSKAYEKCADFWGRNDNPEQPIIYAYDPLEDTYMYFFINSRTIEFSNLDREYPWALKLSPSTFDFFVDNINRLD